MEGYGDEEKYKYESTDSDFSDPDRESDETHEPELRPKKRKLPPSELFICVQCHAAFSTEDAWDTKACRHHIGEMQVDPDSDTWDDWDEGAGLISDQHEAYPEGFIWDCCQEPGIPRAA